MSDQSAVEERGQRRASRLPHLSADVGPEFLPELKEQHTRTLTLIDNATSCGHTRVAEMNQQVVDNLDRMINELEDDEAEGEGEGEETADAS